MGHYRPHGSRPPLPLVLIIDDDEMQRKILREMLQPLGCELAFADSGAVALEMIQKREPDVLLLDVVMPEITGFDLCGMLKKHPDLRHIPIILITALDTKADLVRGLESGADEFLTKPVTAVELRARVRSMLRIRDQYEKLRAAMKLRESLSRMVIHDMRTPLTVITADTQYLMERGSADKDVLEEIHTQSQRLNGFTNDVLTLARMEAGKLQIVPTVHKARGMVERTCRDMRRIAETRSVIIQAVFGERVDMDIRLDGHLVERVIENLVNNAIKFSPSSSEVKIGASVNESGVLIVQVADQGPGIPMDCRSRIFEPFEVVRMREQGTCQTGLGLAFCKQVIDAHGGVIRVEDNAPRGARFTCEIPTAPMLIRPADVPPPSIHP